VRDTTNPLARRYYLIGNIFFEQGKHDLAIQCYTRATEEDPAYSSAYFNRTLSYAISSMYDLAAKDAITVMKIEPDSHDGPYVMGVICEYTHNLKAASEWYKMSLKRNPDYSPARERLRGLESRMEFDSSPDFTPTWRETNSQNELLETSSANDDVREPASGLEAPSFGSSGGGDAAATGRWSQQTVGQTLIVEGQIKGHSLYRPEKRMSDVAGLDDLKRNLERTVVRPAKRPQGLKRWQMCDGFSILLFGPSGCGKTHLAEALAGEIGAYILIFNLNEVVDMYSGNTEKNMHGLFQQARDLLAKGKTRYIVVFIDELDAIGMNRGLDRNDASYRRATNQLLMELDGMERNPEGLIVVGATNRPWDIDPALKRAGRFGDEWYVPIPSPVDRESLFELYLRGLPVGSVDYRRLARATKAYSPADIKNTVRKAKFSAWDREDSSGKDTVLTTDDLLTVVRSNKGSSLYNWFQDTAEEFASKPLDKTRYKQMLDDMVTVLGHGMEPRRNGGKGSPSSVRPRDRQAIPAYA